MAPYGSWPTPITSELVVRAAAGLGGVALDGDDVWWSEQRPDEGGRTQLVRARRGEPGIDALGEGWNARTAVHEYGGGAWWVRDGTVWFANWADQRLHVLPAAGGAATAPGPITPEPEVARGDRWAHGDVTPDRRWIAVVREHHPAGGGGGAAVVNEIVVLDASGELAPRALVTGPDFVADPRFSPDARRLSWLQWNHPDMPWDGTELCVADLRSTDIGPALQRAAVVAGRPDLAPGGAGALGGRGESIFQPRWAPDGTLWFSSDRSGWWNLYRWRPAAPGAPGGGDIEPTVIMDAEIGMPQWVFGQSRYAFLDGDRVVFAYQRDGIDHLAVRASDGAVSDVDVPYTSIASLTAAGDEAVLVGASVTAEPAVVRLRLDATGSAGAPDVLRPPRDLGLDTAWFSVPEHIDFPTSGGRTAHALFYPPTNPDVPAAGDGDGDADDEAEGSPDERPPLLVLTHGGPTSAARPMLQLGTQYWTSRGFAVVDVNYGGSTGYGRAYRDQLAGAWGVVDVDDCDGAARWLADQGRVDFDRLCIRGGSAGGYTTLAALALRDTFAAGASHFGVADLEALAVETHKFESRYLDGLIGPYPAARDVYIARSPIHHLDQLDRPLAVFQGLEDEIVPPAQSEMIVEALRTKGVPVAYVAFEGEQHGFRQAANIRRALDGELSFYAQVLGFELPAGEHIEPIVVENL
jgi:dipeptidyl aminopeptidase/acylaminoacyl peptidase